MTSLIEALGYIESIEAMLVQNPAGPNPKALTVLRRAGGALSAVNNSSVAIRGRKIMRLAEKYYGSKASFLEFSGEITGLCAEMKMEISATQRHLKGEC